MAATVGAIAGFLVWQRDLSRLRRHSDVERVARRKLSGAVRLTALPTVVIIHNVLTHWDHRPETTAIFCSRTAPRCCANPHC